LIELADVFGLSLEGYFDSTPVKLHNKNNRFKVAVFLGNPKLIVKNNV
jgi:hypothetical protein